MIGALLYAHYAILFAASAVACSRGRRVGMRLSTGLLLLGEPFSLSPLMTALFLITCGVLALSRFLLEEEILAFIGAALCFGLPHSCGFLQSQWRAVQRWPFCSVDAGICRADCPVCSFSARWLCYPGSFIDSEWFAGPQYGLFGGILIAMHSQTRPHGRCGRRGPPL